MSKQSSSKKETEEGVNQRIRIKVRAYDHTIIEQSAKQIVETAKRSGANISGPIPLPTERSVYTVNRSPFIDTTSKDQYEMRVHKRLIDITNLSPKTIDSLMNLNLPAGVDVEIKMQ